jgi:hypothetical protein
MLGSGECSGSDVCPTARGFDASQGATGAGQKTSVALEAKALRGDGVEVPEALAAVTATLRTMAKLTENNINAIEHEFRQLRGSTKCYKVRSGPTPEEFVGAASDLAELLACLGTGS